MVNSKSPDRAQTESRCSLSHIRAFRLDSKCILINRRKNILAIWFFNNLRWKYDTF